jgi:hypothetical protein
MSGASGSSYNSFPAYAGAIGAGIGSLFNQNPATSGMNYLNQMPSVFANTYSPYMQYGMTQLNPYLQNGQNMGGQLSTQTQNIMNNPGQFINQVGQNFQASPGYGWDVGQMQNSVNNAAAAGGMAGSPMEQQNMANTVGQLANQNYYQYLGAAMQPWQTAYQGAQNMYGIGANAANNAYGIGAGAANNFANNMGETLGAQANMAYNGTVNQNQSIGGGIGSIASGVAGMLGGSSGSGITSFLSNLF